MSRLETEVESLRKRLSTQHQETRTAQRNADRLRAELAQMRAEKEKLEQELTTRTAEEVQRPNTEPPPPLSRPSQWPALQRANSKHSEEIQRLRSEHRLELDRVRSHHATELANLKKSLFSKRAAEGESDSLKLQELEEKYEARLQALRERLRASEHQGSAEQVEELNRSLTEERTKSEQLARRVQELEEASKKPSARPEPASTSRADDLTRLKGVGPKLADALNREGVHSLEQVAQFTDEDLEALAPKIKFSAARMKKNEWIETARRFIS